MNAIAIPAGSTHLHRRDDAGGVGVGVGGGLLLGSEPESRIS